jgi:hypothetical protein
VSVSHHGRRFGKSIGPAVVRVPRVWLRMSAAGRFVSDTLDMSQNVVTSLLLLVLLGPDLNCVSCCHCSCTIETAACVQELPCGEGSTQDHASISASCEDSCCHLNQLSQSACEDYGSCHNALCRSLHQWTPATVSGSSIEESTFSEFDDWSKSDSLDNVVAATRICRSDARPATFAESRLFVKLCSLWI